MTVPVVAGVAVPVRLAQQDALLRRHGFELVSLPGTWGWRCRRTGQTVSRATALEAIRQARAEELAG